MAVQQALTFERFLVWQSRQETKHEYDRGRVIPFQVSMPGGSMSHHQIEINLVREIANAFEDSHCRPFTSNLLLTTQDGEVGYYPDAVLLDGPPVDFRYGTHRATLNPAVVFEISSPSTAAYDRGRKLEVYRSIPSMREIVLIRSDAARIVRHFREGGEWQEETVEGLEARLTVLGVSIPLARLYKNVEPL